MTHAHPLRSPDAGGTADGGGEDRPLGGNGDDGEDRLGGGTDDARGARPLGGIADDGETRSSPERGAHRHGGSVDGDGGRGHDGSTDADGGEGHDGAVTLSVIIPAYNAASTLPKCLAALGRSEYEDWECLLVDDGSTDETPRIAGEWGARVIRRERQGGPAAGRNEGARGARGRYLLFIDADVTVHPDTLGRAVVNLEEGVDAVFGSYDDDPPERALVSRYKNLFHHYTHQRSSPEARTFWAGCGAVRRDVFLAVGGFNEGYERPSIEDIELGYRLFDSGHRIRLDRDMQVAHLKRWTLRSLVVTDVTGRGIPWSRLLLRRRHIPGDLNTRTHHKLSIAMVWLGGAAALAAAAGAMLGQTSAASLLALSAAALLLMVVAMNVRLYGYLARKGGAAVAAAAVPLHLTYYGYSGLSFLWALLTPDDVPDGALSVDESAAAGGDDALSVGGSGAPGGDETLSVDGGMPPARGACR